MKTKMGFEGAGIIMYYETVEYFPLYLAACRVGIFTL